MTLWDRILIISVIAVSIFGMFLIPAIQTKAEQEHIVIEVDGKTQGTVSMEQSTESRIYDFRFGENTGYVEVKNGAVRMLEMDKKVCPRRICSQTGWISKGYQSIVCLPNRISVRFDSEKDEKIDDIAY